MKRKTTVLATLYKLSLEKIIFLKIGHNKGPKSLQNLCGKQFDFYEKCSKYNDVSCSIFNHFFILNTLITIKFNNTNFLVSFFQFHSLFGKKKEKKYLLMSFPNKTLLNLIEAVRCW